MKTTTLGNPFFVGRYVSPEYFCDRKEETAFLIKQIENGRNVALISPRRMGKTGLINHCFRQQQLTEHYHTIFVDIYATTSLAEFVYLMGKAIFDELKSRGRQWTERFFQVIASLRVGFKLDGMTGEPSFDIGLGDIQSPQTTLDEIFRYLESADKPCVVAIDEFQQIAEYPETNIEAMLRTRIQQCRQTLFIFAGSRRHVMNNMFNSSSKPFYQSAISMGLKPIPVDVYTEFARRLFAERGKTLEPTVVEYTHRKFGGCTWFVQMMMNELFAITAEGTTCSVDMIEEAERNVVFAQENTYKEIFSHLAPKQKLVLQAIAREGTAKGVTSAAFIKKYNLPSTSSVQAAIKGLLRSDILTQEEDSYRIYDYFFSLWAAKLY